MDFSVRLVNDAISSSATENRVEDTAPARRNEGWLRELMVRYQQGDAAAVETLVTNLSPALLRFCWGAGMSRSDAEDLLQDCWMRIHRARHTYLSSQPLLPWIFAVARHTRLDAYRRRRRLGSREVLVAESPGPAGPTPPPENDVMDLVNRLPDGQRSSWPHCAAVSLHPSGRRPRHRLAWRGSSGVHRRWRSDCPCVRTYCKEHPTMKAFYRILSVAFLLASLTGVASAAQVTGILMDKMCSASAVKQGQAFATKHDTKCALEPDCQKTGYGVFTADNKFIALDAAGNAKAAAALKATKKADNLKVTVEGDVTGDTIKVASLKLQ